MTRTLYRLLALCVFAGFLQGCSCRPIVLYSVSADPTESGRQWVWPFFLEGKPTVVSFWNTDNMQCLRDVAALRTLYLRDSGVELVTVVTGVNHYEVEKWLQKEEIRYVVLQDFDRRLASRLQAPVEPLFVYFDASGEEISRAYDVRTVHNWFDRPRWLEESGARIAWGTASAASVDSRLRETAPAPAVVSVEEGPPPHLTAANSVSSRGTVSSRRSPVGSQGGTSFGGATTRSRGGRAHWRLGGRGRR